MEIEEKDHDEVEESGQRDLKLQRWQENEASDFLTKPAKTRKVKAAAGDDASVKLIKVAKGMYFPPDQWNDQATLAQAKLRVTRHKLDVVKFFKDEKT